MIMWTWSSPIAYRLFLFGDIHIMVMHLFKCLTTPKKCHKTIICDTFFLWMSYCGICRFVLARRQIDDDHVDMVIAHCVLFVFVFRDIHTMVTQ